MNRETKLRSVALLVTILLFSIVAGAQSPREQAKVRTMTIPVSIYTKQELKENQAREFVEAGNITLREDDEEQVILSIRSVSRSPLSIAVLVQDDLVGNINLQLSDIKDFIRGLPSGSRVMVAYLRSGRIEIRQSFTSDLEAAADSIRIVVGSSTVAPRNPYDGVIDVLDRFDALPVGRRAILLLSDGLDVSGGLSGFAPANSQDLGRAILQAQRKGVPVYSFYSPATYTEGGNSRLVLAAQSSLAKISRDTGGRAFFQGRFSPVSFEPFFGDLGLLLNRQFAITYLSTHMEKGYHEVEVLSSNPELEIDHPKGYFYRKRR